MFATRSGTPDELDGLETELLAKGFKRIPDITPTNDLLPNQYRRQIIGTELLDTVLQRGVIVWRT